jgi:hypothetical protein
MLTALPPRAGVVSGPAMFAVGPVGGGSVKRVAIAIDEGASR